MSFGLPPVDVTGSDRQQHGRVRRRRVLGALAAVGGAAVAGCAGPLPLGEQPPESGPTAPPLPDRPGDFETPAPPAFENPDEVTDGVAAFRGIAFERTPSGVLRLDLYRPADDRAVPLVVHAHGGRWQAGERGWYEPWHGSQGMAVATVDYRLSGTATYPAAVRDVAAAVTWLRRWAAPRAGIDPDRVVLRGESAGAHLAGLLAVVRDEEAFHPRGLDPAVADLDGFVGISGPYDLRGISTPATEAFFGCAGSACPDTYREASPVVHASGDDPPALLWHGTDDPAVPPQSTRAFRDALQDAGVEVTALIAEGAGHVEMLAEPYREPFRSAERTFLTDAFGMTE
jgi:acetyl esterase/lipase